MFIELLFSTFNTVKLKPVKSKHNNSKNLSSLETVWHAKCSTNYLPFQISDLYIELMLYAFNTVKLKPVKSKRNNIPWIQFSADSLPAKFSTNVT